MKRLAVAVTFFAAAVHAQPVSYESVRLADVFVESTWGALDQSMPTLMAGLESQLKANGTSEKVSRVFVDELRKSITRENVAKGMALMLSESYTQEELREIAGFVQSKTGQKYLRTINDARSGKAAIGPAVKQACEQAYGQLSYTERYPLREICK